MDLAAAHPADTFDCLDDGGDDVVQFQRLTFTELVSASDPLEIFGLGARAEGNVRLHVDANADHITDAIENAVGAIAGLFGFDTGDGFLELPSLSFDFKSDAFGEINFGGLQERMSSGSGDDSPSSSNQPETQEQQEFSSTATAA